MLRRTIVQGLAALATLATATAQDTAAKADELVQSYVKQGRFTGSVLLARDGRVVFQKGYGMANLEHDVPNTPQTKFRLGSLTKQFAAAAILLLEQDGKLKVDDPISKYVDECPDAWRPITIHHLLTHTSGIPNVTSFPEYRKTYMLMATRPAQTAALFKSKPLDFAVGERFSYSNSGYVVLAVIVEKASGKTWEESLDQRIFSPLGMTSSGHDTHAAILKHRATGYSRQGEKMVNSAYHDMSFPIGGGDLYSTVEDMLKWDQALYTEKLLPRAVIERMFTPVKNGYAYGWGVSEQFKRKTIGHGGGINGFATFIGRFPDDRLTVVVLANMETPAAGPIGQALAAIAFGEKYDLPVQRVEAKLPATAIQEFPGEYELRPGFVLTITREGDALMSQATGQPKLPIYAESPTKFFLKVVDAQLTFVRGADGKVNEVILHQGGREIKGRRIR